MPGTDFFDDDLVRQREAAKRLNAAPGGEPFELDTEKAEEAPVRPISDFNLTRMARHKKEVDEQATAAVQELDRLRKRQEQLESEKRELEDLKKKQEDYERGKREIMDRLKGSLVTLERQEVETQRLAELLGTTRHRFRSLLEEFEAVHEESWPEDQIRDELNKGLSVIESARMEYNKGLAKIEAVRGEKEKGDGASPVLFEERAFGAAEEKPFAYWIKVGLAVTTPLIIALLVLVVLVFAATSGGWI
jgi:hypothetical protein